MITDANLPTLVLSGGRIIDPGAGTDRTKDLAWQGPTLLRDANGTTGPETRVLDCRGLLVVPGLIDLHTHVFANGMEGAIGADIAGVTSGVTTVVDAGSAGAKSIDEFLGSEFLEADTRIIVFLNLARGGLAAPPEIQVPEDADIDAAIAAIERHSEHIAGIKVRAVGPSVAALGANLMRRARTVAGSNGLPVMLHLGDAGSEECIAFAPQLIDLLEPGDILTHVLSPLPGAPLSSSDAFAATVAAMDRGVTMDMGHGIRNFSFAVAETLMASGILPDTISTDMGKRPRRSAAYSATETMSKMLYLGVPLQKVIAMMTTKSAAALGRQDLGHLRAGGAVDATVLKVTDGEWALRDSTGETRIAAQGIVPVGVVREGRFVAADWGPHPSGWLKPVGMSS